MEAQQIVVGGQEQLVWELQLARLTGTGGSLARPDRGAATPPSPLRPAQLSPFSSVQQ
jgi:hypothetical protein